jgi:hypothetical protein
LVLSAGELAYLVQKTGVELPPDWMPTDDVPLGPTESGLTKNGVRGRAPAGGLGARPPENTSGRVGQRFLQTLLGPRNERGAEGTRTTDPHTARLVHKGLLPAQTLERQQLQRE